MVYSDWLSFLPIEGLSWGPQAAPPKPPSGTATRSNQAKTAVRLDLEIAKALDLWDLEKTSLLYMKSLENTIETLEHPIKHQVAKGCLIVFPNGGFVGLLGGFVGWFGLAELLALSFFSALWNLTKNGVVKKEANYHYYHPNWNSTVQSGIRDLSWAQDTDNHPPANKGHAAIQHHHSWHAQSATSADCEEAQHIPHIH